MNTTFNQHGEQYQSPSNKDNMYTDGGNVYHGKPQFGGCALVVVLGIVASGVWYAVLQVM